jgi:hypothetical protein
MMFAMKDSHSTGFQNHPVPFHPGLGRSRYGHGTEIGTGNFAKSLGKMRLGAVGRSFSPEGYTPSSTSRKMSSSLALVGVLLTTMAGHAASISVPNYSFESQLAGPPNMVDTRIDSWQKAPQPGYYDPTNFGGVTWDQTAGVFLDNFVGNPAPLANRDGNQGAYMLAFPGVSLFQDYNTTDWAHSTPTHAFDATFQVGQSYQLTIGVLGKNMPDGTTLMMGLYYGDSSNPQTVASTFAVYSAAVFPSITNLVDFTVTVPYVQASDAWAGQHMGIEIVSTSPPSAGYWDLDNVRLTSVPEPGEAGLLVAALSSLWSARRRFRRA